MNATKYSQNFFQVKQKPQFFFLVNMAGKHEKAYPCFCFSQAITLAPASTRQQRVMYDTHCSRGVRNQMICNMVCFVINSACYKQFLKEQIICCFDSTTCQDRLLVIYRLKIISFFFSMHLMVPDTSCTFHMGSSSILLVHEYCSVAYMSHWLLQSLLRYWITNGKISYHRYYLSIQQAKHYNNNKKIKPRPKFLLCYSIKASYLLSSAQEVLWGMIY